MNDTMSVSESELHAFIDGALDADRSRIVAAQIAADPVLADRVAGFRADMAMLKQAYGPLSDRPLPPRWQTLAEIPGLSTALGWRGVAAIAALLLVALAPFAYRALRPAGDREIVAAALAARQNPAQTAIAVTDADAARYDGALSQAVSQRIKAPDLRKMGYRLTALHLYSNADGNAAELVYSDQANRLFTLYLRHSDGTTRFDQFEQAGLRVCVWQDDELGMVMAGNVTTAAMQRLASIAYTGLTL